MADMPPDDPGVAPPFHELDVDEDGVATPPGVDTSTEADDLQERIDRLGIDTLLTGNGVVDRLRLLAGALRRQADRLVPDGGADPVTHFYRASADVADEGADRIERLRSWKDEACEVIEAWELVWSALGEPGDLGDFKSAATLAAVERLVAERDEARAEVEQLRAVLAANTAYEDTPCRLDHHGYCQEHMRGDIDGRCSVAVARELLAGGEAPAAGTDGGA